MSYRDLKSYQSAVVIYDFTVEFCRRYVDRKSRTTDQMVQAARSGKQNIVEGSAAKTSEQSELKLLGVARASFQELLEDYEDFLRQRGLRQWEKDDPEAVAVRRLAYQINRTDQSHRSDRTNRSYWSSLESPAHAANAMICLINQTNFLLDQQIRAAERQFVKQGDYSEQLRAQRAQEVKKQILKDWWRKYQ